jgi:hypothetical protein
MYVYDPPSDAWTSTILEGGELVVVWLVDEVQGRADIALARGCDGLEAGQYVGVVTPASLRLATDEEIGDAVYPEVIFHGCCGAAVDHQPEHPGLDSTEDAPCRG